MSKALIDFRNVRIHFPRMHLPGFRLFWALTAGTAVLAGCSRTPSPSAEGAPPPVSVNDSQPMPGDWVVQQIGADPDSLNPIVGTDSTGQMIDSQIFEGLLTMNNFTLKLEPCLAEKWEVSPDQLTYTFHLRHDVAWQDGVPLTAADVKYTYDCVQDPKVDAAPIRSYFTTIKSCEVLDPYTIRFTASERYFKTLEELGTLPVIPQHLLERQGGDFNNAPFNRAPVGTGPYRFVRWDTGSQVVLERNDHYWGQPNHYLKRIVYRIIQEPYVAAQLLKKGEIDLVDGIQPLQWQRELAHSRAMKKLTKIVYDYPAYSYLGFNLRRPIFSDIRVRHAIDLLVPRDQILAQIYLTEYGRETEGYDLPSSPNYNHDIPTTPYDPAQAAQLLREAGWLDNAGDGILHKDGQPLSITLDYPAESANDGKILEILQESLRRAGIDLKLQRLEWVQLLAKLNDWNFDMTISGWALDINGDPSQLWSSSEAKLKKSSNFIGYSNPEADKLIAAGRLEYDDAKRAVIYRQLQKIIHDDYPVCFLFNPKSILLVSNRFQNVRIFAPRPCFDVTTWWVPKPFQKYR
jgi:peptide/nickel transport system substrate-binding protein